MIELETYECPHCAKELAVNEIAGLADDIETECSNAAADAKRETEAEFDGMVDPSDLPITPRAVHDLAVAIRRKDDVEGRRLLGLIAYELGGDHEMALECGWFSPEVAA